MNCTQCGAPIVDDTKFCNQCGARIESMNAEMTKKEQEENQAQAATASFKQMDAAREKREGMSVIRMDSDKALNKENANNHPLPHNGRQRAQNIEVEVHSSNWLGNLFHTTLQFIKRPVMDATELDYRIEGINVLIYPIILIVIGAVLTYMNVKLIFGKLVLGASSIVKPLEVYLSNTIDVESDIIYSPFVQQGGIKILGYTIISHFMLITFMMILLLIIFKKRQVTWDTYLKAMTTPLAVLIVGKLGVLIISLINGTVGFYFYILVMFGVIVMTLLQLVNLLGKSPMVIYLVPVIYLLSALLRNKVILELIKTGLNQYYSYY